MKKIVMACVALVSSLLLCASFASAKQADHAKGGKSAGAKACVTEKKADKAAFKSTYGKHAMRSCIKGETQAGDDEALAKNAAKDCKAERALDRDAFALQYGTNRNGKNAFGKCVSANAKAGADDDDEGDDVDDDDEGDDVDTDDDSDDGTDVDDGGEELPVS